MRFFVSWIAPNALAGPAPAEVKRYWPSNDEHHQGTVYYGTVETDDKTKVNGIIKRGWNVNRFRFINQIDPEPDPVITMRLCEQEHLVLRADVLYRFEVDPNCARCRAIKESYE